MKQTFTGYIPSPPDSRDYPLLAILKGEKPLPKVAKLPQSPIKIDQGNIPKCVGSAMTGIYNSYHFAKGTLPPGGFSDDYAYQRCKQLDGHPDTDGTFPRIMMHIALHEGICSKQVWDKYKKLCPETYKDAEKYKIKAYARLESLDEMKKAIADGKYLMFANMVTSDWMNKPTKDDGYIAFPSRGTLLGGHATYVTGYDDLLKHINEGHNLGTNSWGEQWGNNGNYQMPYGFVGYKIDIGMPMLQEVWAVEFEGRIEPVTASKIIKLKIDSNEVEVNGVKEKIDTEPIIHKDRTLVPIRFIAEELGAKVDFVDSTREVIITVE